MNQILEGAVRGATETFWKTLGKRVVTVAVTTTVEWSIRNGLDIWRRKKLKADFRAMDQRFKAEDEARKKEKESEEASEKKDEEVDEGSPTDVEPPSPEDV